MRLGVAAWTPLSPDEAYYWVWSKTLANGYLDHPPAVAWFIRVGTLIGGDTAFGIRLSSPVTAALGSLLLVRAADTLFAVHRPGVLAAVLLNATLMFGIGAVTMTPDTPLLLFWTFSFAAMADMATGRGGVWRFGIGAGLAALSKYTAVLMAPAFVLWLVLSREQRGWLLDRRLWLAGVLALLIASPVLVWNAGHDWASFAKQAGRTGAWEPRRAVQFVGELVGGQVGLATPVIALLCGAGLIALIRRWREPAPALVLALTLVPASVFVEHALGDRVQANWPAITYPTAVIAAALLVGPWRRLRVPAIAVGFVMTALVIAQGIAAPFPLRRAMDPTLMRLGGWTEWAAGIAEDARWEHAAYIAVDSYGQASLLALMLPASIPVLGVEDRWRLFDLPNGAALISGNTGLLVRSARRADPPDSADWSSMSELPDLIRGRDGVAAETYHLYRVIGAAVAPTPIMVLPMPRKAGEPP